MSLPFAFLKIVLGFVHLQEGVDDDACLFGLVLVGLRFEGRARGFGVHGVAEQRDEHPRRQLQQRLLRDLDTLLSRQFALTYLSTHADKGFHKVRVVANMTDGEIYYPKGYTR